MRIEVELSQVFIRKLRVDMDTVIENKKKTLVLPIPVLKDKGIFVPLISVDAAQNPS